MTRRRISASTPYQATLQSSDRIVMTRKSATAVRAVLPAAAALAHARLTGMRWQEALLLFPDSGSIPAPTRNLEAFRRAMADLAKTGPLDADDIAEASALACLHSAFPGDDTADRRLPSSFAYPLTLTGWDRSFLQAILSVSPSENASWAEPERARQYRTIPEPLSPSQVAVIGSMICDTPATARAYLRLIEALADHAQADDQDLRTLVRIEDVPRAIGLDDELSFGVPEAVIFSACLQCGISVRPLQDGGAGALLRTEGHVIDYPSQTAAVPMRRAALGGIRFPDPLTLLQEESPFLDRETLSRLRSICDRTRGLDLPGNVFAMTDIFRTDDPIKRTSGRISDADLVPCAMRIPVPDARMFQLQASPEARTIAGLTFNPVKLDLQAIARHATEMEHPEIGCLVLPTLLGQELELPADVSSSDGFSWRDGPFLPMISSPHWSEIARLLDHNGARLWRSHLALEGSIESTDRRIGEVLLPDDLPDQDADMLDFLQERRGAVGQSLEDTWKILSALGGTDHAIENARYLNNQTIPRFEVDGHLFLIERKPLLDQIRMLEQADCHGLVWSRVTTGWSPVSASPDDAPTSRDDAHAMVAPIDELAPDTMETAEQEKSAGVDKKDLLFRQPPSRHRIVLESVALTFDVLPRRDLNEPLSPLDFLSISRS